MITGASTANLAIILIDARKGLVEQTYRHSLIASLVGVSHILVCVNKMDLVNFDEHTYASIVSRYKEFSSRLDVCEILFVPISALVGDNIVYRSENMPWYTGPPLLDILETVEVEKDESLKESRFPVQYVVRPQSILHHDFRGYAGRVVGGVFRVGDEITTLPASLKSKVKEIWLGREKINEAFSSMSVLITLEHDIDVSRGDIIVKLELPKITHEFELMICWMAHRPLLLNNRFSVQHTTREVKGVLQDIKYKLDINTGRQITGVDHLMMNDIACVKLITSQPLFVDSYRRNRTTGSLIFVDDSSNETLAAGMII
jgi:sulfate adenylyltransferase subunit 1